VACAEACAEACAAAGRGGLAQPPPPSTAFRCSQAKGEGQARATELQQAAKDLQKALVTKARLEQDNQSLQEKLQRVEAQKAQQKQQAAEEVKTALAASSADDKARLEWDIQRLQRAVADERDASRSRIGELERVAAASSRTEYSAPAWQPPPIVPFWPQAGLPIYNAAAAAADDDDDDDDERPGDWHISCRICGDGRASKNCVAGMCKKHCLARPGGPACSMPSHQRRHYY
jgi:hypothetical protein